MALSQTHCAVPDKETLQDSCQWCSATVGVHHAPLGMAMHPWVQSHVPRAAGPRLCAATTPVWQGSHPVAMAQQGAQCRPGALPQLPFLQFLKPWRCNTKNDSRAVMLWIGTPRLPSHHSTGDPSPHPGASQNTPEPWACSRGCLGAAVPTCSITPPLCRELLCCAEHSTAHWCHQWAWLGRPACSTPSAAPTKSPPTMPGCVCGQPQSNTAQGSGAPPEHSAYVPHLGSLTGDLAQSSCFGILLRYHAWGPC